MKIYFKTSISIILFLFSIIICSEITDAQREEIAKLKDEIFKAPDFTLESVRDSSYNLNELNGKVVLLNFWATWCGPCRMEIPDFNELYLEHRDDGFIILGISTSDTKEMLQNFLKSYKIEYPVLYGSITEINKVSNDYGGIMALPTSVLVGRNGQIIRIYPGAILKDYAADMYSAFIYDLKVALRDKWSN